MAEFASTIVGLVAVGVQVGTCLHDLVDAIRDAPKEFQKLWEEEKEFRQELSQVLEARQLGEIPVPKNKSFDHVDVLLERAFDKLQEMRLLVREVSEKRQDTGANVRVNKMKWLYKVKKVKKLQEELRLQRAAVQALRTKSGVNLIWEEMRMQTQIIEGTRSIVLEMQDKQLALLRNMTQREARLYEGHPTAKGGHLPLETESANWEEKKKLAETPKEGQNRRQIRGIASSTALRSARRRHLVCREGCSCRCHRRSLVRTPRQFSNYLGDLFMKFSSLPWGLHFLEPCDVQTCRRSIESEADVKYYLSPWLTVNAIRFSLVFSTHRPSISVSVQTRNTIPYDSAIHLAIQNGQIEQAKDLLCSGSASLNDVDPFGLGLLYYAAYYCERSRGRQVAINMCQKLLELGAHADREDEIGNTPAETMTENILASRMISGDFAPEVTEEQLVDVARIFDKCSADLMEDYISERKFTPLHEALLGIDKSHGKLAEYLASLDEVSRTHMIDVADARGRTPLAWAVEFGCPEIVELLIEYGSDPHQLRQSVQGTSPLLHLVIAGPAGQESTKESGARFVKVVRTLVKHGVDINAVDHEGWTALHVAASWNLLDMVEELAHMDGQRPDWDAVTNDGQTALDLCRGGDLNEQVESYLMRKRTGTVSEASDETEELLFFDAHE